MTMWISATELLERIQAVLDDGRELGGEVSRAGTDLQVSDVPARRFNAWALPGH
jgi:hypothetical protein